MTYLQSTEPVLMTMDCQGRRCPACWRQLAPCALQQATWLHPEARKLEREVENTRRREMLRIKYRGHQAIPREALWR